MDTYTHYIYMYTYNFFLLIAAWQIVRILNENDVIKTTIKTFTLEILAQLGICVIDGKYRLFVLIVR